MTNTLHHDLNTIMKVDISYIFQHLSISNSMLYTICKNTIQFMNYKIQTMHVPYSNSNVHPKGPMPSDHFNCRFYYMTYLSNVGSLKTLS